MRTEGEGERERAGEREREREEVADWLLITSLPYASCTMLFREPLESNMRPMSQS